MANIKNLNTYKVDIQRELFDAMGAFFSFNDEQLTEKKKDGIEYCKIGGGIYVPKENIDFVVAGLIDIAQLAMKRDLKENGREGVIRRELSSLGSLYIGDIEGCINRLKDYGISAKEIQTVYYKILETESVEN